MEIPQRNLANEHPNTLRRLLNDALERGTDGDLEALFEDGMSIDQEDFEGRTALMMSCAKGKKDVVEMLLRRGADVNRIFMYQDRMPQTALDAARECRKSEIEAILLSHGAKTGKELKAA